MRCSRTGRTRWDGAIPWVLASLFVGIILLIAFPIIESRVEDPMFKLSLFRIRIFSLANIAGFLSAIARGGVMFVLIMLLQGVWLPLHGYSYESTPFWAGVFMLPLTAGLVIMGPLSGWLYDKYGSRLFATAGMLLIATWFPDAFDACRITLITRSSRLPF